MKKVTLVLSDGTRFHGKSFGYEKPVAGEVVFNTAQDVRLRRSHQSSRGHLLGSLSCLGHGEVDVVENGRNEQCECDDEQYLHGLPVAGSDDVVRLFPAEIDMVQTGERRAIDEGVS